MPENGYDKERKAELPTRLAEKEQQTVAAGGKEE
jgi:hypothetical protein